MCYDTIREHYEPGAVCQCKIEIVRDGDAEFAPERFFTEHSKAMQLLLDIEEG